MPNIKVDIEESWKEALADEFCKPYFLQLTDFIKSEKQLQVIYPPGSEIFAAFRYTPLSKVKVVLLGQDPYHGEGQAHGLCFSVPDGKALPPSLKNVYKELKNDLGGDIRSNGNLSEWAQQGVLLLNTTLTVRKSSPASHFGKGWEKFTDEVIKTVSRNKEGVIFLLWGNHAKQKQTLIDNSKHHVLLAPHPSPFSAYTGFFGCKHFSKTNQILSENGFDPIIW